MTRHHASLVAGLLLAAGSLAAQQSLDTVQVRTVPVADGVYMLAAAGGNIGLSVGKDAAFLVDDQFAPLTEKIRAAIAGVTDRPIRFVLNTHWHFDHTGGNENLGKVGALLVAHETVRRRMSVEQFIEALNRREPPSPEGALPVITFTDAVTFYLNGDTLHAFHVPPAHTDGDAIVHFRRANVIHMGDLYFAGRYPFVDLSSGGSLAGVIGAVERVLAIADANTKIIPGHGALSNRVELQAYRDMLVAVRGRMGRAMAGGKTLEQVKAARPTAEFDAQWGGGFVNPELLVEILYKDLSRAR